MKIQEHILNKLILLISKGEKAKYELGLFMGAKKDSSTSNQAQFVNRFKRDIRKGILDLNKLERVSEFYEVELDYFFNKEDG